MAHLNLSLLWGRGGEGSHAKEADGETYSAEKAVKKQLVPRPSPITVEGTSLKQKPVLQQHEVTQAFFHLSKCDDNLNSLPLNLKSGIISIKRPT